MSGTEGTDGSDSARGTVDDVQITSELKRRPSRPVDHASENRALTALAREMAANPSGVLQKCAELVIKLCHADSAGIGVLEPGGTGGVFRWHAAAGAFAANVGRTIPQETGPFGTALARNTVLLFNEAEQFFPALLDVEPRAHESLLAPWHVGDEAVGTLWAAKHTPEGRFDAEDARLLAGLARFASAAHQMTAALAEARQGREALEQRVEERTRSLSEARRRLQTSEARLRAAVAIGTVGIIFFDTEGRITDGNAAFLRMAGFTREDLEAGRLRWDEMTPPEWMPDTLHALGELRATGQNTPFEKEYIRKDGSRWWGLFAGKMLDDDAAVEFVLDISERKRTEAELREKEERFRLIVENARGHAIYLTDPEGRIVEWLPGAAAVFGWTAQEAVGQHSAFVFTPEDREAAVPEQEIETARREGTAPDVRWHLRKDGSRVFIEGIVTALRAPNGGIRGFLKIGQDATERRAAEEALRESERRFRVLAEGIPQLVFRSRSTGERTWGSPQWVAYTGLSEAESLGFGWLDAIHPEDRAATMAAWGEAETHGLFSVEHRTLRAADGVWRWFQSRAIPVQEKEPGQDGDAVEWLGTSTDIDDQVQAREVLARSREELEALVAARTAELMAAEETVRQAQKMEAVGQLTGGIAHDFNNMLQGVVGGLNMARRRLDGTRAEEARRYLDAAHEAADRAAGLTRRLLAFARRQRLEPKAVNTDTLIAGLMDLIRRSVGPGVAVELKLRDGIGSVLCDPNELESALLNLCINARDAMPEGGRLSIATEDVQVSAKLAAQEEVSPGIYTAVSVTDTGMGMPPEVLERVFEPFFTTKPLGRGTGLGLSQVYGFVRQSSGLVQVESTPGRGTTVRLLLPLQDQHAEAAEPMAVVPAPGWAGTDATVLLVDDEDMVRRPAAERLRELGHQVLEAADGPAALRLLSAGTRVDLLVTDVGLPGGMNGRQVAEAARERLPDLPVLFITGYAGTPLPPGIEVIGKPFELDDLARRAQAILEARRR